MGVVCISLIISEEFSLGNCKKCKLPRENVKPRLKLDGDLRNRDNVQNHNRRERNDMGMQSYRC